MFYVQVINVEILARKPGHYHC